MRIGDKASEVIAGRIVGEPKYKEVGAKNSHLCTFGVSIDSEHIRNVQAWFEQADACANLHKGDRVIVAGTLTSNEYEGKTYWNLNAECVCKSFSPATSVDDMETLSNNDIPF